MAVRCWKRACNVMPPSFLFESAVRMLAHDLPIARASVFAETLECSVGVPLLRIDKP